MPLIRVWLRLAEIDTLAYIQLVRLRNPDATWDEARACADAAMLFQRRRAECPNGCCGGVYNSSSLRPSSGQEAGGKRWRGALARVGAPRLNAVRRA